MLTKDDFRLFSIFFVTVPKNKGYKSLVSGSIDVTVHQLKPNLFPNFNKVATCIDFDIPKRE